MSSQASSRLAIKDRLSRILDAARSGRQPWPLIVDACFGVFLIAVAVARYLLAGPLPLGVDPGNWLAIGHSFAGEHIRSGSIVYPPVVPALIVGFTQILGPTDGIKMLAAIASIVPAGGAYLVLRANNLRWEAAICAAFLAPAASTGEATAWGGYPQLIGLGLMPLFLWHFDRFLRSYAPAHGLIAGVLLAATLATSEIIGGSALVVGGVLAVSHLIFHTARSIPIARLPLAIGLLLLPSLPLVPVYLTLGTAVLHSFEARPPSAHLGVGSVLPALSTLFQDFPRFWRGAMFLTFLAPLVLLARRRLTLSLITSALLVSSFVLLVVFGELRFVYLLPLTVVLGLASWLQYLRRPDSRPAQIAIACISLALVLALGAQVVYGLTYFQTHQATHYRYLTPGLIVGIDWLRTQTPRTTLVAVSPTHGGFPVGWWVEGLGRRRTLTGSDLIWLYFPDERDRAKESAKIFLGAISLDAARARAKCLGADYMFVDKTWSYFGTWSGAIRLLPPGAVVIDNESLLLVRTRGQDLGTADAPCGYG